MIAIETNQVNGCNSICLDLILTGPHMPHPNHRRITQMGFCKNLPLVSGQIFQKFSIFIWIKSGLSCFSQDLFGFCNWVPTQQICLAESKNCPICLDDKARAFTFKESHTFVQRQQLLDRPKTVVRPSGHHQKAFKSHQYYIHPPAGHHEVLLLLLEADLLSYFAVDE